MALFTVANAFTLLGLATFALYLRRFASFIHIYYFHSTTIQRYLMDADTYALITGASAGLGKELAVDLYDRGFNVVIHGPDSEKLEQVRQELQSRSALKRDVVCWAADCVSSDQWDFSRLTKLKITAVFLNAGGSPVKFTPVDKQSEDDISATVRLNALFPLSLMRALLPQFRASRLPILVVAIGSVASTYPPPFLAAYAASKAFLAQSMHGMSVDERFLDPSADMTFHYMHISELSLTKDTSFRSPSPQAMARYIIAVIGCGHREVVPYIGHVPDASSLSFLGEKRADAIIERVMEKHFFKK
ncbi:hypothetical protein BS47DRAFT_1049519 [Hydnum rufescens UP504]|uniref:NAD(P)-binding protein n=1 Tax=Hydnum rufescens UP504 TaxID=1448309 RepID=A0A9P6AVV8_9AGAM|nr:hypothetical protein BS47DRAFT_1049519 [Hydnum rufescens UP504]